MDLDTRAPAIDSVLKQLDVLDEPALDALPYGLIQLDFTGKILKFNKTEAELAHVNRRRQLGKNFFLEVAPCTRVQEFYGRFVEGVARKQLEETFNFVFQFAHGPRHVVITLHLSEVSQSVWLLVSC